MTKIVQDNENKEIITGSDFKRMVQGAYSEFLLEFENINILDHTLRPGHRSLPGTNILRTMGAAVLPLNDTTDDSIGGLARRAASAALLGARGNAGVVLSQIFRGLAKGLLGKYNATSSEFGKAFQYGILYAQRVLPEEPERPIITAAKAVAKGAYQAVRANLPISEILAAALDAGESPEGAPRDVGEEIMLAFLRGCLKGLDGNFVSPSLSFSVGSKAQSPLLPDPRQDRVQPYCLTFVVMNTKAEEAEVEKHLQETSSYVVVERYQQELYVHLHTDNPGAVLDRSIGWGPLRDIRLNNMAEPHAMTVVHSSLMPVALVAIADTPQRAEKLQNGGAAMIVAGNGDETPSVGALVNAAHSDLAASYVMVPNGPGLRLVLQQAKRILGDRVEIVTVQSEAEQLMALRGFDSKLSAKKNAARMMWLLNDK